MKRLPSLLLLLKLALGRSLTPPPLSPLKPEHINLAKRAMSYFDMSTDPFHAVQTSVDMLQEAGFTELAGPFKENVKPGGRYYYTKDKSTLVAFVVGNNYSPIDGAGFKVIGAHTDSPNLRVKPRSKRKNSVGDLIQIGVECYGGGLWHTWFDRDLGLSGRVLLRVPCGSGKDSHRIEQKLVKINRPLLRIPNLAIHLQTTKEREAFVVNKEDHLSPILAMEIKKQLLGDSGWSKSDAKAKDDANDDEKDSKDDEIGGDQRSGESDQNGWVEYQSPPLLQLLAQELDVPASSIVDFELNLFDVQRASLGGVVGEFIHSARLDNLASCFMAIQALIEHIKDDKIQADKDVAMVILYDHEEVGSASATGAASPILSEAIRRITAALQMDDPDIYSECIRKSFVLSSDQAHAVHPNYSSKHEKNHQPKMNHGMVIKRNANQRYATSTITGVILREIARRAQLGPIQEFVVRQDCGCGSTIGPILSSATGIRAVDMGCPQLSMHSIRETMGTTDIHHGLNLFKAFFEHFHCVNSSIED